MYIYIYILYIYNYIYIPWIKNQQKRRTHRKRRCFWGKTRGFGFLLVKWSVLFEAIYVQKTYRSLTPSRRVAQLQTREIIGSSTNMEKGSKDREGGDCPNEPSASCGQMPERAQSLTWTWGPSMCHHASPQHNWVASVNHLHHQKLARDFWPRWTCEHALHVSGDVASIIFELENCQKRLPVGPAARPSVPILFLRVFYGYPRVPCDLRHGFSTLRVPHGSHRNRQNNDFVQWKSSKWDWKGVAKWTLFSCSVLIVE